jgi:hypothetical protein
VAHRLGQRVVLGGEHPAQTHPLAGEHPDVQLGVGGQPLESRAATGFDGGERVGESSGVAGNQGRPEFCLAGEMVVQGRLGDAQLGRDVRVGETVEPAGLYEPLGDVPGPPRGCLPVRPSL